LVQFRFEISHVVVPVTKALGIAEADAVNDRRVIQLVGDDYVLGTEQRLEQATVRVKGRRINNRVLSPEEFRQRAFEIFVDVLRAANKTDAGHAEAVGIERLFRGGDERGMIRSEEHTS